MKKKVQEKSPDGGTPRKDKHPREWLKVVKREAISPLRRNIKTIEKAKGNDDSFVLLCDGLRRLVDVIQFALEDIATIQAVLLTNMPERLRGIDEAFGLVSARIDKIAILAARFAVHDAGFSARGEDRIRNLMSYLGFTDGASMVRAIDDFNRMKEAPTTAAS